MRFQRTKILLLHMYRSHLPLAELYSVALISSNVMWNIRNEVDKTLSELNTLTDLQHQHQGSWSDM